MSFPLSPEHLAHMYECLRQLPPFTEWKLPESDAVKFRTPAITDYGEFRYPNIITVSSMKHGHFDRLMETLAHEMVHYAQALKGTDNKAQHNADFKRRAKRVCSFFGWDYKGF